jgi:hypothetical protein
LSLPLPKHIPSALPFSDATLLYVTLYTILTWCFAQVSVGIEDISDIIADFKNALELAFVVQ